LINELRDELSKESELDEAHKQRLLKRLEALQKELHKKVSDLDHFCGLLGDSVSQLVSWSLTLSRW
jgi:hypothetical protein